MQMDLKASPVDHVVLALDVMDINDADDFKLTENLRASNGLLELSAATPSPLHEDCDSQLAPE